MRSLHGVGVLVTRPEHQAHSLCRLLEVEGATTARLPAMEIVPYPAVDANASLTDGAFDLIVFTSANAVQFGSALLTGRQFTALAAIGPATARALSMAGYTDIIVPSGGFDSESLLSDARVAAYGQRVLLVKGRGGRSALWQELTQRGASVEVADVYERRAAVHSLAELEFITSQLTAGSLQVMTATSAEIAANLLALATPDLRRHFERLHWLVPSMRVAAAARELGIAAPLVQADSAEDHDLVAALVRWRSSQSGA